MKELKSHIVLRSEPLRPQEVIDQISQEDCGALELFIGTVRNHNKGKGVLRLDFSAYEPMAIKEMQKIADYCLEHFGIKQIAIHHAIGELAIGDLPVIIGVSSVHRETAQKACKYAIDRLKEVVPIWKKEYCTDGTHWVNATP